MSTSKTYDELRKINVNEHVEKKNNLSYLSWAWAVDILFQHDPDAAWDYTMFDGKPWMVVGETYMVFCTVTAFGRVRTAQLPIMDYKNKAVPSFTSFDLNTTMQRCLAKAISLHGIGLYIYAGEDLPEGGNPEPPEDEKQKAFATPHKPTDGAWEMLTPDERIWIMDLSNEVRSLLAKKDIKGACDHIDEAKLDGDQKVALWGKLADLSAGRNAMKKEWAVRRETADVAA